MWQKHRRSRVSSWFGLRGDIDHQISGGDHGLDHTAFLHESLEPVVAPVIHGGGAGGETRPCVFPGAGVQLVAQLGIGGEKGLATGGRIVDDIGRGTFGGTQEARDQGALRALEFVSKLTGGDFGGGTGR